MKIAIFDFYKHTYIGGVEKYVRHLIEALKNEGHEITEFYTMKSDLLKKVADEIDDVKTMDASGRSNLYRFKSEKIFKNVVKSNKFDLIINNSIDSLESFKNPKIINIQHMGYHFYETKGLEYTHRAFKRIFLGLGHMKNQLEAQNVVFYSIENNHGSTKNPFYIPLCNDSSVNYKPRNKSGNNISWIARHDEPHKGLGNLNNVYNLSKNKDLFIIGGSGKDTRKIKIPSAKLIGGQTKDGVQRVLRESKVFILTSNYEGFGYTVVESLSNGTPVVMYDTFDSAKFFDRCDGVYLIKSGDHRSFANKVDDLASMPEKKWMKISMECINFAKKELSFKTFETKWKEVINETK